MFVSSSRVTKHNSLNMKLFLISCLVAFAAADVSHLKGPDADAQILKQDVDVAAETYKWLYETSNGIAAEEQGQLKGAGENAAIVAQGQYSYSSPEGEKINVQYIADENGFQPQGAHIPTPPAIPEAILRSLEYNRAHPEPQKN